MLVRIKFVARLRVDLFNMCGIKCFLQLVQSHLHAHFQGIEITALVEQRHFKVVFDRQHFGRKFLSGEFMGIGDFLLMAAAQVLLVCQTAQLAVFELAFQLGNTRLQIFVSRLGLYFGLFGFNCFSSFYGCRFFGCVLVLFVTIRHF